MRKPDRLSPGATVRCAIYTRKSSDEGLDQEFNSLDAQREACAAYILSQKHAGWVCLPDMYDDGGLSGGTMERPALQRLLGGDRGRQGPDRGRLQGRSAHPFAGRLRQDRRCAGRSPRLVRVGDAAVQYDDLDGPTDAQHAALVRPVRARDRWRAHSRQDRRVKSQGHVDGRQRAARLRRQRPQARRERGRRPTRFV